MKMSLWHLLVLTSLMYQVQVGKGAIMFCTLPQKKRNFSELIFPGVGNGLGNNVPKTPFQNSSPFPHNNEIEVFCKLFPRPFLKNFMTLSH